MSAEYRIPTSLAEVRAYVASTSGPQNRAGSTVILNVSHSNFSRTRFPEIRLDRHLSVGALKQRLYTHTGTLASSMKLRLLDCSGALVAELGDEARPLGFYGPQDGFTLQVLDEDPHSLSKHGALEDMDLVQKYTISDEDYARRPDTYVKYRERMREKDPSWTLQRALGAAPGPNAPDVADERPRVDLGERAEVYPGGKRGVVRFVGRDLPGLPAGWWVGVEYDEPVGKNDGEVGGVRYFKCERSCGGFVRPSNVKVGDFPPLDDGLFSDSDEI